MSRLIPAITAALVMAMGLPVQAACTASDGVDAAAFASSAEPEASTHNPRVAVSCLVQALPASTHLVLDVRPAAARSRVQINDAMVADLAGLTGWKATGSPITLVGSGLNQEELLRHCGQLRRRGIDASVLDGGLQNLPVERRTPSSTLATGDVEAAMLVEALRSESSLDLVAIGDIELPNLGGRSKRVDARPTVSAVREMAGSGEAVVLIGAREHAQAWWSALRGAGARRVFVYGDGLEALKAATEQLQSVHQGRHWVPPTPCERQG